MQAVPPPSSLQIHPQDPSRVAESCSRDGGLRSPTGTHLHQHGARDAGSLITGLPPRHHLAAGVPGLYRHHREPLWLPSAFLPLAGVPRLPPPQVSQGAP